MEDLFIMNIKDIRIKDGYILRELGGEFCLAFVGDTNNGALNGLPSINETGVFLWSKLERGYSYQGLIKLLMERDSLDYEEAEADVIEFLAKLINGNIIDYESSPESPLPYSSF